MTHSSTIHASAVLIGRKAVLIRGPSGAGKSRLAWDLVHTAAQSTNYAALPFARLVGDDRVHVEAYAGRLLVRAPPALAGLIEVRDLGVRKLAFEPIAQVGLVVDLAAADAERMPQPGADQVRLEGVELPRLAVAAGMAPLPILLAFLATVPAGD
jgi:serine kinase of HPr protein (carbohydrate metabolism regulator)